MTHILIIVGFACFALGVMAHAFVVHHSPRIKARLERDFGKRPPQSVVLFRSMRDRGGRP